jgi:S1-C subfamily serine protease
VLEVDRGNVVRKVMTGSAAAAIGLQPGDVVESLGGIRVRSFADAQYALDKAPAKGTLQIVWQRRDEWFDKQLRLNSGWRRSDILWRPSMYKMIAAPRVFGDDLNATAKATLGLAEKQLAFRQRDSVSTQARKAGIRAGDIILGFEGKQLEMDAYEFQSYVRREYLSGDIVKVIVIRDGQKIILPMKLH